MRPGLEPEVEVRFYRINVALEELINWTIANSCIEETAYLMSAQTLVQEAKKHATSTQLT